MGLQRCASCHLKAILGRLKPSCLQVEEQREEMEHEETNAEGAEIRELTLEEHLYSSASLEMEAIGAPPLRRHSPKVCPLNLDCFYENYSPTNVNESFSIDRVSLRSQNSTARRVSFRSPDESDIYIIPARNEPEDDSDDEESTEDVPEEGIGAEETHHVQAARPQ